MVTTPFDPARLIEYVFNVSLWDTPAEIVRSVFTPHSKTVVKACHSSSKTHTAGLITALAPILKADVVTTAPTDLQVEKQLWAEVRDAIARSKLPPSEWTSLNLKELKLPTGEWAIGFTTKAEDSGVRFQGFHAREGRPLILIVDEALGVSAEIFTAIDGIAAGGDVRRLYLCNPTIVGGPIYDLFASDAPGWNRITIDAFDTPNLRGYTLDDLLRMPEHDLHQNPVPYLVTKNWVVEKYHEWGEEHPDWEARVRARFPTQGTDALIALGWVEDANRRAYQAKPTVALSAGIDVAGPGEDETVVAIRRGNDAIAMKAWSHADARDEVIEYLRGYLSQGLKFVAVDSVGMGHFFHLDIDKAFRQFGVEVLGANVGLPSLVKNERGDRVYANLKAEWFWHLRRRFMDGDIRANGVIDQTTLTQLVGIKYTQPGGIVTIEKKEDARKRGVKSPDRAEAWMLAYAPDDPSRKLREKVGKTTPVPKPRALPVRHGQVVRAGGRR